MLRRAHTGAHLALILIVVLLTTSVVFAQDAKSEPVGFRPDAPTYAVHGPYWVGAKELTFQDGKDTVGMVVWYPALNPKNDKEEMNYTVKVAPSSPDNPFKVSGQALQDAAPDTTNGSYPLILFSSGLAGFSTSNAYLLEHLASYGFVVISWDPRGETFEEFWAGAVYRLRDPQLVIARAEELTSSTGELANVIDMKHIGIIGHSSGGWTALAGGGAQLNFGWCDANKEEVAKNSLSNCGQFVPHSDEIASMIGLSSSPTGMWPPTNDPRVQAVISMAGDGDIWGANYEGIASLKVPTMIMGGSKDSINIPEITSYPIYEHLGSPIKSRVIFANGDHMIFFDQCRVAPWLAGDAANYWVCADAVWDMDRVHDLIDHMTTAFLLDVLKGDKDAHAALTPDAVKFPGIDYQTTMQ